MQLPGGLWEDGERRTDVGLRPATGELELALAACATIEDPTERVTATLDTAVASLGGSASTRDRVMDLCVDDRRWLMLQLGAAFESGTLWLADHCGECLAPFEIPIDPAAMPVKAAGEGYPFVSLTTRHGDVRLRVPTGADQHAIAPLDDDAALKALLGRCHAGALDDDPTGDFTDDEVCRASEAIETVSPQVALTLTTRCPACGHGLEVPIDPYALPMTSRDEVFDDVHAIAKGYGWSEPEILALPVSHRQEYLRRLERDRG
jgi:hypothetical protein